MLHKYGIKIRPDLIAIMKALFVASSSSAPCCAEEAGQEAEPRRHIMPHLLDPSPKARSKVYERFPKGPSAQQSYALLNTNLQNYYPSPKYMII